MPRRTHGQTSDTMEFNYPFGESWATNFEDSKAYKYKYTVFYNRSVIFEKYLVSVDGGRATLSNAQNVHGFSHNKS